MKKNKQQKVIYYSDEINEDFFGMDIQRNKVDHTYKYIHKNPVWHFCSFVLYYIIAVPLVCIYSVLILRIRFVNKKALKQIKQPYFMYGNHTGYIDAFIPNLISIPRKNKIAVSSETVSIKGIRMLVEMLGAVPVPTEISGMKNFIKALKHHNKKNNITIYPEAHIWPYYTGVRPFKNTSFAYPVLFNSPVVAFFTAYTKPKGLFKFLRKANATVYISEPFYPNKNLSRHEAQQELRDKAYNFMKECSEKYSTYEVIKYIKK